MAEINQIAPDSGEKKPEVVNERFRSKYEYYLACIGYAVGFGNVWRFPYMCYKNGGAAFLIPYFIALFFVAVPMYMVETAYGQLLDMKLHQRYGAISAGWWTVIAIQVFVCFTSSTYYITLMAWSISFFFESFKWDIPWLVEGADKAVIAQNLWNSDYFYDDILQDSKSIAKPGGLVGWMVLCMFVAYVCCYFSAWKGLRSIGRIVWVTCLLPYVILTILLVKGLTLEGCGKGLKYLFIPDWNALGDVNVWKSAATQILFSSSVSYGPLMYYATGRGRKEKIITASFIVPLTNSGTSIYAALSIFSFLGHVSTVRSIPVRMLSKSGPDLLFVAFPALLGLIPGTKFFSIVFFAMCVCLGVDSVFGFLDFAMKWFEVQFPQLLVIFKRQEIFRLVFMLINFLMSLIFCIEGGLYVFDLFDGYCGSLQLLTAFLMELTLLPWMFGMGRLSTLMELRTGEKIPGFVTIMIKFFIPAFIFAIWIISWVTEFQQNDSRDKDGWTTGITWAGRLLMFVPMLIIPIGYFKRIDCGNVDDMIAEQYGIKCNRDGTYEKLDNFNNGEPMGEDEDEKGNKQSESATELVGKNTESEMMKP